MWKYEEFYRRHQQNEEGRQKCFLCDLRSTHRLAESLNCEYLLKEFAELPAHATTTRALLIELQSMPTTVVFRQIIISKILQKKFAKREWCLEEAKQNGLAAHTLAQITFFANLWVSIVGSHEEAMACTDEKCQSHFVLRVFCDDAQVMSYDMSSDETHKRDLDCFDDIYENEWY